MEFLEDFELPGDLPMEIAMDALPHYDQPASVGNGFQGRGQADERQESERTDSKTLVVTTTTTPVAKKKVPHASKKGGKSNNWRQERRLELLHLREEATRLSAQLEQLKLSVGIQSTAPLTERVKLAGRACAQPRGIVKLGDSWQDAAIRESLARLMSGVENERLRKLLTLRMGHARKLQQMAKRRMRNVVMTESASSLYCHNLAEVDQPPRDNNAVFTRLLAGLDAFYTNLDKSFEASRIGDLSYPRKSNKAWINKTRGLQVQLADHYRVPFDVESTEQAVWQTVSKRVNKNSRALYAESFECDSNTSLSCERTALLAGPFQICFLQRTACRKYVERERTVFVAYTLSIANEMSADPVTFEQVTWRTVQRGEEQAGGATTNLQTQILGTFPSYKFLSCLPSEALDKWHDVLTSFNHTVEDVAIERERTQKETPRSVSSY